MPDPRWRPLRKLLRTAYQRYGRPFALTETSHPGMDRPAWWRMIAEECAAVLRAGLPLQGVCLYPIIDRPDWDHLDQWHQLRPLGCRPGPARPRPACCTSPAPRPCGPPRRVVASATPARQPAGR